MRGLAIGIAMSGGPFGGMILTGRMFPFYFMINFDLTKSFPSFTVDLNSHPPDGHPDPLLLSTSIFSRGFGSSVRITAFLIAPLLVIGNLLMMNPPVEQKSALPVPKLDIARYSKEYKYLAAAAG
jgi:hypothetical protein